MVRGRICDVGDRLAITKSREVRGKETRQNPFIPTLLICRYSFLELTYIRLPQSSSNSCQSC